MCRILSVPHDLLHEIFQHLTAIDLTSLGSCRELGTFLSGDITRLREQTSGIKRYLDEIQGGVEVEAEGQLSQRVIANAMIACADRVCIYKGWPSGPSPLVDLRTSQFRKPRETTLPANCHVKVHVDSPCGDCLTNTIRSIVNASRHTNRSKCLWIEDEKRVRPLQDTDLLEFRQTSPTEG